MKGLYPRRVSRRRGARGRVVACGFAPGRRAADHAARRRPVQRRPRVQQGAAQVRGAGQEVLRQADQLRAAPEQRARPREAVLRVHGAGQGGRLRDRFAGAHVDVLQGRAVHRRAVPVPRPRALEQGARRRSPEAGRRRDRAEGGRDADRLRRRRHAQHLRQQAGAATWPRSRASRFACRARRSGARRSRRRAWRPR